MHTDCQKSSECTRILPFYSKEQKTLYLGAVRLKTKIQQLWMYVYSETAQELFNVQELHKQISTELCARSEKVH